jgi:uncharacterized protein YggE
LLAVATIVPAARAQQVSSPPDARIVVSGEGSVSVAPDHAQFTGGVTTRGRTVKETTDVNSKVMVAVMAALAQSGIAQTDIQTSRFSIQPVYASAGPSNEPKLSGYSVSNQVHVKIREIGKVGDVLDRLVAAGVTDVGSIAFLVADPSQALDQAREAALADARRKAEVYARAAGLRLGQVQWITEDAGSTPAPLRLQRAAAPAAAVPIAAGEDVLRAKVTVGFDIAH